ncbi:MAG: hypothetical protein ACOYM3_19140 [Terrimicrobiaceae bacterium]
MKDPTANLAGYREFLDQQLCWVDGIPTHASSQLQRQCPKCRMKWSYERLVLETAALEEFCLGSSASKAARKIGCVKNTALSYFGEFRRSMEERIADHLLNGSIATNPVSAGEWQSLERHLFMSSLTLEERLEMIFRAQVIPKVKLRYAEAVERRERQGGAERPFIAYAAPTGRFRKREPAPKRPLYEVLRSRWTAFWREIRARRDRNCPYPSRACEKLGKTWVRVWEKSREHRTGEG